MYLSIDFINLNSSSLNTNEYHCSHSTLKTPEETNSIQPESQLTSLFFWQASKQKFDQPRLIPCGRITPHSNLKQWSYKLKYSNRIQTLRIKKQPKRKLNKERILSSMKNSPMHFFFSYVAIKASCNRFPKGSPYSALRKNFYGH